MSTDSERIEDGLSRRQVLARGAVAAGVIWAAPVIRSATAYATSAAGTERPCINFYLVCCDALGMRPVRFGPDEPGYDDISAEAAASVSTTTSTSSTTTSSTTTTTAPPAPTAQAPAPAPASTTTSSTTTTTSPGATDTPTTSGGTGTDSTPPTTTPSPALPLPQQDPFGLFSDPTAPDPTTAAGSVLPVDPHVTLTAAALAAKTAGTPDVLPPGIQDWLNQNPDVPVRYPTVLPGLTQSADDAWAITLPAVDGPDPLTHQCRVVNGWAASKGKYGEEFLDPNPEQLDDFGRRAIFPNPRADELANDPTALIESIMFVFCCPQ